MIVMASIGATMTIPMAPRLPVMIDVAAEPAITRTQTSETTIDHAIEDADGGAGTTRSEGRLRSSSTLSPRRTRAPSLSPTSPRTRNHRPRCQ